MINVLIVNGEGHISVEGFNIQQRTSKEVKYVDRHNAHIIFEIKESRYRLIAECIKNSVNGKLYWLQDPDPMQAIFHQLKSISG